MRRSAVWLLVCGILLGLAACATRPRTLAVVPAPAANDVATPTAAAATGTATAVAAGETPLAAAAAERRPTIAAPPTATTVLPEIDNPLERAYGRLADSAGVPFIHLNLNNSGTWNYASGSFAHPLALEVRGETAYLLDAGRVLQLDLANASAPQTMLAPGALVAGVPVIEPLDLSLNGEDLLVLDRAGDVYAYDLARETWSLRRYDRPIGETSSHYFVALSGDVLVEPSYNFALRSEPDEADRFWLLPAGERPVDVTTVQTRTFALLQDTTALTYTVRRYDGQSLTTTFQLDAPVSRPRQLEVSATAVSVLDEAGRRLLEYDVAAGDLQAVWQLPAISTFWTNGERYLFAGRDQLFFWQQPERRRYVSGPAQDANVPQTMSDWLASGPFILPVQGTQLGTRELQMPGAPRHYRLGVHEGIDFYWAAGTPVRAVADGVVVRATLDYEAPEEVAFDRNRDAVKEAGQTPPALVDFYRGRQVWIEHADGSVARYAHLSEIAEGIGEGSAVVQGQTIGKIGNTGTPSSILGPEEDAHLHFELWRADHFLGQYLSPVETRELVAALFQLGQ